MIHAQKMIIVNGAKAHNLKDVSVSLPRDTLIVFTGLSGSGKSSLAFDTIYAEGQRRYIESLSAYARQFLDMMNKPEVDSITGLSPAISIEQKTTSRNPRSTVGTLTEIYDYLRLLFARVGIPYSPATGLPIVAQTISQMVDRIMSIPDGTRAYLFSPVVRNRKGEYKKFLADIQMQGFQRVRIDGEVYELGDVPALDKKIKHDIDVLVDRLVIKEKIRNRLAQSMQTALQLSDGIAVLEVEDAQDSKITLSDKFACPVSGFCLPELEPSNFSFNSPVGRCQICDGLGVEAFFSEILLIADQNLSLSEGAISPWIDSEGRHSSLYMEVCSYLESKDAELVSLPWNKLTDKSKYFILYGDKTSNTGKRYGSKSFIGIINLFEKEYQRTRDQECRDFLRGFRVRNKCSGCNGYRLRPDYLCVRVGDLHIGEVTELTIGECNKWVEHIKHMLSARDIIIAEKILKEIHLRLKFLVDVGLDYLTLSRETGTLSGGESQRIRLASQIGSGLTGVLYVLDEPSIGLHQRDNERLIATLKNLRNLGNTVIVVEHDADMIMQADHIVDMGPGAGNHGGYIVAQGTKDDILNNPSSITGQYLSGIRKIASPHGRRKGNGEKLTICGASENNLKNISLNIPLGVMTCITGVSGSGKSTLIVDTLYREAARKLNGASAVNIKCSTSDFASLDKVINIDQGPIGRTPRSNPATYTGIFVSIREWFASLPIARERGYGPGRFSFNVKGGRCEACKGEGVVRVEMHFLPDVFVECDVCKGARYNRETMDVVYQDKSIADVLNMSVEESYDFFHPVATIRDKLLTLKAAGLGYMKIGQNSMTLSGGEAQRIKLAKELSKRSTGRTLYILDEPTTGLHFEDINNLLQVLNSLVELGNTIVVIEHNLDFINVADWIIDIGPEGGDKGGEIIVEGSPEYVSKSDISHTGKFLRQCFYA